MELSMPVATPVEQGIGLESLNLELEVLLENIKVQRENYSEFCEDEHELDDTLNPIEQDPEPYSNGTIKTRPILKRYAKSLCEKLDLELRIRTAEEMLRDVNLTPQQVKCDMKRYVAICEKKIASQKEICEQLQEQVKQFTDVVSLMALPNKGISTLSAAMNMNLTSVEQMLLNGNINCLGNMDILFAKSTQSIQKLLIWGADIDQKTQISHFPVKRYYVDQQQGKHSFTNIRDKNIVLDPSKKHFIPIYIGYDVTILNLGPYNTSEIATVCSKLTMGSHCQNFNGTTYELTPLKIASLRCSLELVSFLVENGATIGDTIYHVPNGPEGDLVTGYLQTHGSKPVIRF